jgi:hypothetical protein
MVALDRSEVKLFADYVYFLFKFRFHIELLENGVPLGAL